MRPKRHATFQMHLLRKGLQSAGGTDSRFGTFMFNRRCARKEKPFALYPRIRRGRVS
jgi:hypothetical protein